MPSAASILDDATEALDCAFAATLSSDVCCAGGGDGGEEEERDDGAVLFGEHGRLRGLVWPRTETSEGCCRPLSCRDTGCEDNRNQSIDSAGVREATVAGAESAAAATAAAEDTARDVGVAPLVGVSSTSKSMSESSLLVCEEISRSPLWPSSSPSWWWLWLVLLVLLLLKPRTGTRQRSSEASRGMVERVVVTGVVESDVLDAAKMLSTLGFFFILFLGPVEVKDEAFVDAAEVAVVLVVFAFFFFAGFFAYASVSLAVAGVMEGVAIGDAEACVKSLTRLFASTLMRPSQTGDCCAEEDRRDSVGDAVAREAAGVVATRMSPPSEARRRLTDSCAF